MPRRIPTVVLFSLAAGLLHAGPRALTLEEALRRVEEASPFARAIARETERARAAAQAAGLWDNPDVGLEREESATTERFATLSLRLSLWGRAGLERDAAGAGAAAAEAEAGVERLRLRAATRVAFVDLLAAQERQAAMEGERDALADLVTALRQREHEGESSAFDRRRAERELAEFQADLAVARGRAAAVRARLAALVDLPAEPLVADGVLATPATLPAPADLHARAASRGDVVSLARLAEASAYESRALRRALAPEPTLTVGRKVEEEGDARESGPILGLSFPLPVFRRAQGARAAEAESALLQARHEAALRRAEAEIDAARATAEAATAAAATYAADTAGADLAAIARAAYDAGEARILELLDTYRLALETRLRRIDLDAAAAQAAIDLDLAVGAEVVR